MDGRPQRIPKDIEGEGVEFIEASCGAQIYAGPGARGFRCCASGHVHCLNCGWYARKYGRTYSCQLNCKGDRKVHRAKVR